MNEPSQVALDRLEHDALTELINIGVSRAASNLRTMINQEVLLSVPSVTMVPRDKVAGTIGARDDAGLVAVRQVFEGDVYGRAMLIFPETNSLELVRAVTGGSLAVEDILALEHEALAETGNIILNSCLSAIANMLRRSLRMSLPEVLRGAAADLFEQPGDPGSEDAVLLITITFAVNARQIAGHIAMVMDLPALRVLKQLLGELIHRSGGVVASSNAAS